MACLATATGRDEFRAAAAECIAYENASFDAAHSNWPHFRSDGELTLPCQWCHGAPGIGLARIAMRRQRGLDVNGLTADIRNAVLGVRRVESPRPIDTLCCGTLGNIEFLCEAGSALGREDIKVRGVRRLLAVMETAAAAGDYRWHAGDARFNLGLFRGLAGLGYTLLRRVDGSLPNVLIWE
jgi:lantibiotic modifying enzyme